MVSYPDLRLKSRHEIEVMPLLTSGYETEGEYGVRGGAGGREFRIAALGSEFVMIS